MVHSIQSTETKHCSPQYLIYNFSNCQLQPFKLKATFHFGAVLILVLYKEFLTFESVRLAYWLKCYEKCIFHLYNIEKQMAPCEIIWQKRFHLNGFMTGSNPQAEKFKPLDIFHKLTPWPKWISTLPFSVISFHRAKDSQTIL